MKESTLIAKSIKYDYLNDCGIAGGYKQGYMNRVDQWIETNPEKVTEFGKEAVRALFGAQWSPKLSTELPSPQQGDLMINDKPCPHEIRHMQEGVPGGWVTILIYYATFSQWRMALEAKRVKVNESNKELVGEYDLFSEGLARVQGDETKRIFDSIDNVNAA